MGQNSEPVDTKIVAATAANNKLVPQPTGGAHNKNLSINEVGIGFLYDQVCVKVLTLISPMTVNALEIGGDSASQYHKKN